MIASSVAIFVVPCTIVHISVDAISVVADDVMLHTCNCYTIDFRFLVVSWLARIIDKIFAYQFVLIYRKCDKIEEKKQKLSEEPIYSNDWNQKWTKSKIRTNKNDNARVFPDCPDWPSLLHLNFRISRKYDHSMPQLQDHIHSSILLKKIRNKQFSSSLTITITVHYYYYYYVSWLGI